MSKPTCDDPVERSVEWVFGPAAPVLNAITGTNPRLASVLGNSLVDELVIELANRVRPAGQNKFTEDRGIAGVQRLLRWGGFVDQQFLDELRAHSKIRNQFAHRSDVELNFDSERVAGWVDKLTLFDASVGGRQHLLDDDEKKVLTTRTGKWFLSPVFVINILRYSVESAQPVRNVPATRGKIVIPPLGRLISFLELEKRPPEK